MNTTLRAQAETIVTASIHAVLPDEAVRRALQGGCFWSRQARPPGRWPMPP